MTICSCRARRFASFNLRNTGSVAVFAGRGCWSVEEHRVSIDLFPERVACGAGHFFMTTLQRKLCLVVIEERGTPLVAVVTSGAIACACAELSRMWVFVAFYAGSRGIGELNMHHVEFHVWRLVAIGTGHRAMGTNERKMRSRVVEFGEVFPLPCGVTRDAT